MNTLIYLAKVLLQHKAIQGLKYIQNLGTSVASIRTILNHFLQNKALDDGNGKIPVGSQKLRRKFVLDGD